MAAPDHEIPDKGDLNFRPGVAYSARVNNVWQAWLSGGLAFPAEAAGGWPYSRQTGRPWRGSVAVDRPQDWQ